MATCHGLAARGHDVTLVVRPDTASPPRDPFVFYDLPATPRLTIRTIAAGRGPRRKRARFLLSALATLRESPRAIVYTRDLGLASFLLQLPKARRPRLVYESHGVARVVSEELPDLLGNPGIRPSRAKLTRL